MTSLLQIQSPAGAGAVGERIVHEKPIALRLTQSERNEAFQCAAKDDRSASSFALLMYRRGLADFKRAQAHLNA